MDPDVIRSIKQAALDLDWTASDIMEEAGKQWLQSKTKKGSVRLGGRGPPDYRGNCRRVDLSITLLEISLVTGGNARRLLDAAFRAEEAF
jgi:hypothetical protein